MSKKKNPQTKQLTLLLLLVITTLTSNTIITENSNEFLNLNMMNIRFGRRSFLDAQTQKALCTSLYLSSEITLNFEK